MPRSTWTWNGSDTSRAMMPSSELRLPRSARASRFGRYPSSAAADRIRSRVSSRTGTPVTRPLRMRETVVIETLAFSATSRSVTDPIAGFIPSVALRR